MRGRRPLIALAAFALLLVVGYFARDYVKLLGPPERCWEIRETDGYLYKVNPCTGQFRLIGEAPGRRQEARP